MEEGIVSETEQKLDAAKKLSEQIVLRDGTLLPQDVYVLTRTLFRLLHDGCTPDQALSVLSSQANRI